MDTSHPSRAKGKRPSLGVKPESPGKETYLISLAIKEDAHAFGAVRDKDMLLNETGKALAACWLELGRLRPGLRPDALRIHARGIQGLLTLSPEGAEAPSLSEAVRLFKVLSSLRISQLGKTSTRPRSNKPVTETSPLPRKSPTALWKKGYSERLVSTAPDLAETRKSLR